MARTKTSRKAAAKKAAKTKKASKKKRSLAAKKGWSTRRAGNPKKRAVKKNPAMLQNQFKDDSVMGMIIKAVATAAGVGGLATLAEFLIIKRMPERYVVRPYRMRAIASAVATLLVSAGLLVAKKKQWAAGALAAGSGITVYQVFLKILRDRARAAAEAGTPWGVDVSGLRLIPRQSEVDALRPYAASTAGHRRATTTGKLKTASTSALRPIGPPRADPTARQGAINRTPRGVEGLTILRESDYPSASPTPEQVSAMYYDMTASTDTGGFTLNTLGS